MIKKTRLALNAKWVNFDSLLGGLINDGLVSELFWPELTSIVRYYFIYFITFDKERNHVKIKFDTR